MDTTLAWHRKKNGQMVEEDRRTTIRLLKVTFLSEFLSSTQGRIKTKLGLMLLPGKGPIFFSAFKTDQEVQDSWLATALSA